MTDRLVGSGRKEQGVAIEDDWPGYNLELFNYPEHYRGDLESVLIPHGVIMNRIECLARDILEDIGHHTLMVLCVLKGGYKFCADLVDSIKAQSRSTNRKLTTRVEFIRLKSYLIKEKRLTYQHQEEKTSIHCCVPLCANSSSYNSEISFHRSPVDPEVRARWLTQIRRDDFSPLQSPRVCSRHFNTGDFVVTAVGKRKLN
ncbi:hypothetical protein NFI96_002383 [Prochilodus magdalenae]|nr:hypothetical protein NFI96_002383 [Prochilodus magdalenae]